jgi:putative transposase
MRQRHTAEQITAMLKEVDAAVAAGSTVAEICRILGISDATYYLWRKRYGSMTPDQLARLKKLEKENARLEKEVADASLDNTILKEVLQWVGTQDPAWKHQVIEHLQERLGVSERRVCAALSQARCMQRRRSRRREKDAPLIDAMRRLSREHPRYGYRRIMALLRAEGWSVNHKRVYRLWRQEEMRTLAATEDMQKTHSKG